MSANADSVCDYFEAYKFCRGIWDKVFKNGPCEIFKGCLPQILPAPYLNTLTNFKIRVKNELSIS